MPGRRLQCSCARGHARLVIAVVQARDRDTDAKLSDLTDVRLKVGLANLDHDQVPVEFVLDDGVSFAHAPPGNIS